MPETISARDFGRLEQKVDSIHELLTARGTRLDKIDDRLRKTEDRLTYWTGGGTVLGAIIGLFIKTKFGS